MVSYWDAGVYLLGEKPFVRLAIWNDGTVLKLTDRQREPGRLDSKYVLGRVAPSDVAKLLQVIRDSGFYEPTVPYGTLVFPDGPELCLSVWDGGRQTVMSFDGREDWVKLDEIGPTASPSRAQVKAVVETWRAVTRVLESLSPADPVPYTGEINLSYPQNPALQPKDTDEDE